MNEQAIIILVLSIVGSLYAFYKKLKSDIVSEEQKKTKPFNDLNLSVIELTTSIKFLNTTIQTLENRVTNHGKEIDELHMKVGNLETKMDMYHHK